MVIYLFSFAVLREAISIRLISSAIIQKAVKIVLDQTRSLLITQANKYVRRFLLAKCVIWK